MFRVGDGVLIGTVGDVGVAILVRMWEQDVEDDEEEQEEGEQDEEEMLNGLLGSERKEKMCEIRWCYRKKDLPGVMGKIQLSDVSISCDQAHWPREVHADQDSHLFPPA